MASNCRNCGENATTSGLPVVSRVCELDGERKSLFHAAPEFDRFSLASRGNQFTIAAERDGEN